MIWLDQRIIRFSVCLHMETTKKQMIWLSDQRIIRFSVFLHVEITKKRMIWPLMRFWASFLFPSLNSARD